MLAAENNRLHSASKPVAKRIAAHIRWLEKELERTDRDLDAAIKSSSPALRENEALLRSVPGVGPVLAWTLLAEVPELGTLTPKRLAALVGVAPSTATRAPSVAVVVCGVGEPTSERHFTWVLWSQHAATRSSGSSTSGFLGRANRRRWL